MHPPKKYGDWRVAVAAALTALSLFDYINPGYTYTLVSDEKDDPRDEELILCDD